MNLLQGSDMPITMQAGQAVAEADGSFNQLNLKYNNLTGNNLKTLNEELAKAGLDKISL